MFAIVFSKIRNNVFIEKFTFVTYDKVLRSLRNLPNKCSKTPDGFPAFFLKSIAPAIAFPLSCYVYGKRYPTCCLESRLCVSNF